MNETSSVCDTVPPSLSRHISAIRLKIGVRRGSNSIDLVICRRVFVPYLTRKTRIDSVVQFDPSASIFELGVMFLLSQI